VNKTKHGGGSTLQTVPEDFPLREGVLQGEELGVSDVVRQATADRAHIARRDAAKAAGEEHIARPPDRQFWTAWARDQIARRYWWYGMTARDDPMEFIGN